MHAMQNEWMVLMHAYACGYHSYTKNGKNNNINGFVQDCGVSSALALETPQSYTKPSYEETTTTLLTQGNSTYRQISNISRTKSQNLTVSCLVLQLSLPNLLKPCVKLKMKM